MTGPTQVERVAATVLKHVFQHVHPAAENTLYFLDASNVKAAVGVARKLGTMFLEHADYAEKILAGVPAAQLVAPGAMS